MELPISANIILPVEILRNPYYCRQAYWNRGHGVEPYLCSLADYRLSPRPSVVTLGVTNPGNSPGSRNYPSRVELSVEEHGSRLRFFRRTRFPLFMGWRLSDGWVGGGDTSLSHTEGVAVPGLPSAALPIGLLTAIVIAVLTLRRRKAHKSI